MIYVAIPHEQLLPDLPTKNFACDERQCAKPLGNLDGTFWYRTHGRKYLHFCSAGCMYAAVNRDDIAAPHAKGYRVD